MSIQYWITVKNLFDLNFLFAPISDLATDNTSHPSNSTERL